MSITSCYIPIFSPPDGATWNKPIFCICWPLVAKKRLLKLVVSLSVKIFCCNIRSCKLSFFGQVGQGNKECLMSVFRGNKVHGLIKRSGKTEKTDRKRKCCWDWELQMASYWQNMSIPAKMLFHPPLHILHGKKYKIT